MTQTLPRPVRVRLQRIAGWRLPADAVSVARPHRWGNPYRVEDYGRPESLRLFEKHLRHGSLHSVKDGRPLSVDDAKRELRGKDLACFCRPDEMCHADVLLRIANQEEAA